MPGSSYLKIMIKLCYEIFICIKVTHRNLIMVKVKVLMILHVLTYYIIFIYIFGLGIKTKLFNEKKILHLGMFPSNATNLNYLYL